MKKTLREMFERWQHESGRCEEMYLAYDGERYVFNDVQSDWVTFQEIAQVVIGQCSGIARFNAYALDYAGDEYVRSRECLHAATDMLALLERDNG